MRAAYQIGILRKALQLFTEKEASSRLCPHHPSYIDQVPD